MPLNRFQLRKYLNSRPPQDDKGTYLIDPDTRSEVYVPFEELSEMCAEVMEAPDYQTGKEHCKSDPTYNLRRTNHARHNR